MSYGFVGLGQMGFPMAVNLARQNSVLAFDNNSGRRENITREGAKAAASLEEFSNCETIFLCLPNSTVVESVIFGEDGLAKTLSAGTVVVDTSTIEYSKTLSIAERLNKKDITFIDAPVSGMQARAEDGTLTIMCGGEEKDIEAVLPLLCTMGSKVLHMGPTGSGQLTKLINQLLFDINAAALAEILPLAVKLGLDPDKIGDVVNSGTGRSYASEFFIPHMLKGDFSNGYSMANAYKDLISGAEISAHHQIPTPVLSAATATYQRALGEGHGEKDKGGMIRVFEDLLDVRFRSQDTKEQGDD